MASIILKNGNEKDIPILQKGEMAYTNDTNKVYIGNGNKNIKLIDEYSNSIATFYVATIDSTNCYKINTNKNLTKLENGFSIRIAIPSASTGDITIKVDTISAINVKNDKGKNVNNFKTNGIYNLTYYNGNFMLTSGESIEYDTVATTSNKVLDGITFINKEGEISKGTMPNNGNYQYCKAIGSGNDGNEYYAFNQIPYGYYADLSEIRSSKNMIRNSFGIENWKIRSDQNIAGVQGTLIKHDAYTQAISIAGYDPMYIRIPNGAYPDNVSSGYPEITVPMEWIRNALGISADKIKSGKSLCGINGTALISVDKTSVGFTGTSDTKYQMDFNITHVHFICYSGNTYPNISIDYYAPDTYTCVDDGGGSSYQSYEGKYWSNRYGGAQGAFNNFMRIDGTTLYILSRPTGTMFYSNSYDLRIEGITS